MERLLPLDKFLQLAVAERLDGGCELLNDAIFNRHITHAEQADYLQLLSFARNLQTENPSYETIYQHILYLYVLNGSRLDLLKTIDRRLRGLIEGQGALILLTGISGIGKTSTIMAFQELVQQVGAKFFVSHCTAQGSISFGLWQEIARGIAASTGIPLEKLAAPIGLSNEAASSHQMKRSFASWLSDCAREQPLVIFMDDLHWADEDSLEILDYLTSQPSMPSILYIAAYRSEEMHSHNPLESFLPVLRRNRVIDVQQLNPMNLEDVRSLVTAFHGHCSQPLADYLFHRAEGHPLFTVELLHDLIARNLLSQDGDGFWFPPPQDVPVPEFLKQLINQRVLHAGTDAAQLLSIASVAGETWALDIIEPLLGLPESDLLLAIENALKAEIISIVEESPEQFRFTHGLIREVLYKQQLARKRRKIHEQIALRLEQLQPEKKHSIAHHFLKAERWERAMDYCLMAGDDANQHLANHAALQWYQRALNATERAKNSVNSDVALRIYDRLGRMYRAIGERKKAEEIYRQMRDFARRSGDLSAECTALVHLSNVRGLLYQLEDSEQAALEAFKIAEQINDLGLLSRVHASLGGLSIGRGELEQAHTHYEYVLRHEDALKDSDSLPDAFRMVAYMNIWAGRYSQSLDYAFRALQLAQEQADFLTTAGARQNMAFAQIELGDYRNAYQNLRTVLDAVVSSGTTHHQIPRLLNLMGYLHLELGDIQEALAWDEKALASILDTHMQSIEMRRYSLLNIATDYVHLNRLVEAQNALDQFNLIKEKSEFVAFRYLNRYQLLLSEIHLVRGDFTSAIEMGREARALAQSKGVRKNIVKSYWLEGQALTGLKQHREAIDPLKKAVAQADEIMHGSLSWKTRLSLAEALAMSGAPAIAVLQQVRRQIEALIVSVKDSPLQDRLFIDPVVQRLSELEHSQALEKVRYPAGLTGREVEVLRLVATGATNQQIAVVLHISVRTVNTHLTNIFNKIDCKNRTAAGAFAVQNHLVST
jgi:predicted ATPase/DNA-binding CsgD family transcriptional regulator